MLALATTGMKLTDRATALDVFETLLGYKCDALHKSKWRVKLRPAR